MGMVERAKPVQLAPAPWPDAPSPDPVGEMGRIFVLNLRDAIGERSIRSIATASNLNHVSLLNILAGRTWPDFATIARLEIGLEKSLWPERPKQKDI